MNAAHLPDPQGTEGSDAPNAQDPAGQGVEGERGIPSVNRIRSMQSRVTTLLAIG